MAIKVYLYMKLGHVTRAWEEAEEAATEAEAAIKVPIIFLMQIEEARKQEVLRKKNQKNIEKRN